MNAHTLFSILSCAVIVCGMPCAVYGEEMVSENFRIVGAGTGVAGASVLTSEHFTLTPSHSSDYLYSDGGSGSNDDTNEETNSSRHGSGSKTVTTTPIRAMTDIVGGVRDVPHEDGMSYTRMHPSQKEVVVDEETASGLFDTNALTSVNTVPENVRSNGQEASLIQAALGYAGDAKLLLSETFKERSSRFVLFISVLAFLALVRSYTNFGRKYRPF